MNRSLTRNYEIKNSKQFLKTVRKSCYYYYTDKLLSKLSLFLKSEENYTYISHNLGSFLAEKLSPILNLVFKMRYSPGNFFKHKWTGLTSLRHGLKRRLLSSKLLSLFQARLYYSTVTRFFVLYLEPLRSFRLMQNFLSEFNRVT